MLKLKSKTAKGLGGVERSGTLPLTCACAIFFRATRSKIKQQPLLMFKSPVGQGRSIFSGGGTVVPLQSSAVGLLVCVFLCL